MVAIDSINSPMIPSKDFNPSALQAAFFKWVKDSTGSAVLIAVAGSGKSTTIVQCLPYLPRNDSVTILAFNKAIADEMGVKVRALGEGASRVSCKTFHSLGFSALRSMLGNRMNVDGRKLYKLMDKEFGMDVCRLYGTFVPKLVALGKGEGIGPLVADTPDAWLKLINHHDLSLDSDDANEKDAIIFASALLAASNRVALSDGLIDFDDQLYLPVAWRLVMTQNDWVFIDECQDTNPLRRALAKKVLKPGGRLVAVGDPCQAIYGFTGASHDAIDMIKKEFNAAELPLTVSYRCPKVAEGLVKSMVPAFSVHENAVQGEVLHLNQKDAVARLTDKDAVLCRNTAPLVTLAFQLIAGGRACTVLGRDIGVGLVNLIRKQRARTIERLRDKLENYRARETTRHLGAGEEGKAASINDRVDCINAVIAQLPETQRTVEKLITKLEGLFSDTSNHLTLCTAHKAKGREWPQVAVLQPELMPSKWARQAWQMGQERNLMYVTWTRFQQTLIFIDKE